MSDVLIGIGNPHRRDDAAGLHVVRRLRDSLKGRVTIHECRGEATGLMDLWSGAGRVVMVDCVVSGRAPGTVIRLDAGAGPLPADLKQTSTHGFGLAEAIELARTLGTLPADVTVYGIEGVDFEPGDGLSAEVDAALEACARRILADLGDG